MTSKQRSDAGAPRYVGAVKQHISVALSPDEPIEKEILEGIEKEIGNPPTMSQKKALVSWYKKLTGKGE